MAEKFISAHFLVPFPKYEFINRENLTNYLEILSDAWEHPSLLCPLNFSSNFKSNMSGFNLNWLLTEIEKEATVSYNDVSALRNETSKFL